MVGIVDEYGRATLPIAIRVQKSSPEVPVTAWVDTGFTGELMFPKSLIESLSLPQDGTEVAALADGNKVLVARYKCWIEWFGKRKAIYVLANEGKLPLLGVALMASRQLFIDYEKCVLELK